LNVLVIEDNLLDVRTITNSLKGYNIHVENDGETAIEYLKKNMPQLIILDLNLLRVDGKEVIKYIKSSPKLKNIPVVVYTTSRNPDDIKQLYDLGASAYITKPYSLSDAQDAMRKLGAFWSLVSFPNENKN
jgi:CheY-like chemotaxis protein